MVQCKVKEPATVLKYLYLYLFTHAKPAEIFEYQIFQLQKNKLLPIIVIMQLEHGELAFFLIYGQQYLASTPA